MKTIAINPDTCTGCRLCELACSLKNNREFNPLKARLQVMGFDEVFSLPLMCFQCARPYCLEACPADAITREQPAGVVKVSPEKCVGCRLCVLACPFGNIAFSSDKNVAVKCELCDGDPECVTFCPTKTLTFVEEDTATLRKKTALSKKLRAIHEGTE